MTRTAKFLTGLVAGAAVAWGVTGWLNRELGPTEPGEKFFVRLESASLDSALTELKAKGVVRNPDLAAKYAQFKKLSAAPYTGTFEVHPGMQLEDVLKSLQTPLRQMVRIPEGWWIKRVAKRLEEKQVCPADEYISLANDPEQFADAVSFPLPETSLEGYLFPDTYDLPPLIGAKETIKRQLQAYESKVHKKHGDKVTLRELTVASMVELEAAVDSERPTVAGVIQNRIKKGQRLEIDATVLYALQEWKVLGPGEVRKVESPYNTYLNNGLPPGPIGSPGLASIEAALNPQTHPYFFYVARPNRTHYFSVTYAEHIANIKKARAEWRAQEGN
ncbi:endolytic transglycosylase MltG [Kamptonema cortianum]|nr:endolytic transglycosylase MltG [Geitlerinema splendidum]MDK3157725.1 endolytic transglycosylase MltG [Kamptonema cortianum]